MGIFESLKFDDIKVVKQAVEEYGGIPYEIKSRLRKYLEDKDIMREYPGLSEDVLSEISGYKVIHAILFGAQMSSNIFQNSDSTMIDKESFQGWIPQVDEDCENLPRDHEKAIREIISFYFRKKS